MFGFSKKYPKAGTDNVSTSEEVTGQDTSQPENTLPNDTDGAPSDMPAPATQGRRSRKANVILWVATVFLLASGVMYLPSWGALLLLVGAFLLCPLKWLRNLTLSRRLFGWLPQGVSEDAVRGAVAAALLIVVAVAIPTKGSPTLFSLMDLRKAKVTVKGDAEYASDVVDPLAYVECDDEDVTLAAMGRLDAREVGTQRVPVKARESVFSKTEDVEINVRDTQAPQIDVDAQSVSASVGEKVDIRDHIRSVSDPVDGKLAEAKTPPKARGSRRGEEVFYDEGFFCVSEEVDTTKAGKQDIVVSAEDKHGNKASRTIHVVVDDPLEGVTLKGTTDTLEYSNKPTDATKLVTCSDAGTKVEAKGSKELDLSALGKKTVTYVLTKGSSKREVDVEFTVRDTKPPVIELESNEVVIDAGGTFDPYANVKSARDVVDGDLARVDGEQKENGNGWFTVTGSYDTNAKGTYELKVLACDKNGNRQTAGYTLKVNEAPAPVEVVVPEQPQQGDEGTSVADVAHDYVLNLNTKVFHRPSCGEINKMAEKNREDVHMTSGEVLGMGFRPCGKCNP